VPAFVIARNEVTKQSLFFRKERGEQLASSHHLPPRAKTGCACVIASEAEGEARQSLLFSFFHKGRGIWFSPSHHLSLRAISGFSPRIDYRFRKTQKAVIFAREKLKADRLVADEAFVSHKPILNNRIKQVIPSTLIIAYSQRTTISNLQFSLPHRVIEHSKHNSNTSNNVKKENELTPHELARLFVTISA